MRVDTVDGVDTVDTVDARGLSRQTPRAQNVENCLKMLKNKELPDSRVLRARARGGERDRGGASTMSTMSTRPLTRR